MIKVTIFKNSKEYKGFLCKGHAGFATSGNDIICAAVSVLTINTVNSIETFTKDKFEVEQADGFLRCNFTGEISKETKLFMDSMVLGLTDIQKSYSKKYMKLIFEEV